MADIAFVCLLILIGLVAAVGVLIIVQALNAVAKTINESDDHGDYIFDYTEVEKDEEIVSDSIPKKDDEGKPADSTDIDESNRFKIINSQGEVRWIEIPKREDVTLSQGLGFQMAADNVVHWLSKEIEEETFEQNRNYYLYLLGVAIHNFTGVDLNEIMQWNVADLLDENGDLYDGVFETHLTAAEPSVKLGVENLLIEIYQKINRLLDYDYTGPVENEYKYDYKGKTYVVPGVIRNLILGKQVTTPISVGQAIDTLKLKKFVSSITGTYTSEIKDRMNKVYGAYLQIVSILSIEEGEEYPDSPEEAQIHYQKNAEYFVDIPYIVANDIVFFLTNSGETSPTDQSIGTTSNHRKTTNQRKALSET